ncbi:hypothetical protein W02_04980 [Nitrospira sp. KM1]|nr:hypothetical protein [Nitrospira sp. KM1]BCA53358.1 hypothetical protein W02_04980 [Nitrospira sp. KM1]
MQTYSFRRKEVLKFDNDDKQRFNVDACIMVVDALTLSETMAV